MPGKQSRSPRNHGFTLVALLVAGTSPSPSALLLAVISLVPPIIVPLWADATGIATAAAERRS